MISELMDTVKLLLDSTVEELYEMAELIEETIKQLEYEQRGLLEYHEEICKVICQKERMNEGC